VHFLLSLIVLKISRRFLIQSEVKPKPIVTRSQAFSALRVSHMLLQFIQFATVKIIESSVMEPKRCLKWQY